MTTETQITPEELAAEIFRVITPENSYLWYAGMTAAEMDEHNRISVEFCAGFLAVYGGVYDHAAHRKSVSDTISQARNLAAARGITFDEAMQMPSPYEKQYGALAALNLRAAMSVEEY